MEGVERGAVAFFTSVPRALPHVVGVMLLGALAALLTSPASASVTLVPVATGLDRPVFVTHAHDGTGRLFIVEQPGVIKILRAGATLPTVFLDITSRVFSGGERGLLGLAFHPDFAANRRFFVNYTRVPDGATVVAEYQAAEADRDVADPVEIVLLVIPQPFANHNGGMVEFGPDGFLYIATGDGGGANDPGRRAQDLSQLLGKILRIDVDHRSPGQPYSSPPDNPFVGAAGRDEIYAYGLRNPFRFSFDRASGALYAGDVGQNAVEEVDVIFAGGNYGWRIWEGTRCTANDSQLCTPARFVFPIAEYVHSGGRCGVIGGYVYRGLQGTLPWGSYLYGDLCTGELFLLDRGVSTVALATGLSLTSFGEDPAGELYVVDLGGSIYRIARACPAAGARDAACPAVDLLATVNARSFTPGDTAIVTLGATNPGLTGAADFYVGVLLPDGTLTFFTSPDTTVWASATDLTSFRPLAAEVPLATPFSLTVPGFFMYRWTGDEPRGAYMLLLLAVRAGALADGVLAAEEVVGVATVSFALP